MKRRDDDEPNEPLPPGTAQRQVDLLRQLYNPRAVAAERRPDPQPASEDAPT